MTLACSVVLESTGHRWLILVLCNSSKNLSAFLVSWGCFLSSRDHLSGGRSLSSACGVTSQSVRRMPPFVCWVLTIILHLINRSSAALGIRWPLHVFYYRMNSIYRQQSVITASLYVRPLILVSCEPLCNVVWFLTCMLLDARVSCSAWTKLHAYFPLLQWLWEVKNFLKRLKYWIAFLMSFTARKHFAFFFSLKDTTWEVFSPHYLSSIFAGSVRVCR